MARTKKKRRKPTRPAVGDHAPAQPFPRAPWLDAAIADRNFATAVSVAVLWALVVFAATAMLRTSYDYLSGMDAFYHLAVSRFLREEGPYVNGLPWTRMSVFREHWGDKELLFHWLLMPFTYGSLLTGGKWALSFINAGQTAVLAYVGVRLWGRLGAIVPLVVMAVGWQIMWRAELLRPHNLSLVFWVLAAYAMCRRRYLGLFLLSVLYPLAYTAWHTLIGLSLGVFLFLWVFRGERDCRLLVSVLAGIPVGIVLHPGFPDNLWIWKLQNIDFWHYTANILIGSEIAALSVAQFARDHAGLWGILLVGVVTFWPARGLPRADRSEHIFLVFTAAALLLYLLAQRFAEYAIPFLSLYLLALGHRLLRSRLNPLRIAWGALALAIVLVASLTYNGLKLSKVVRATGHFSTFTDTSDSQRFHDLIPPGAKVFAFWADTPLYMVAAPHGRYLNVLDPIFMMGYDMEAYERIERLAASRIPDVAHALREHYDSEYIAFRPRIFPDLAVRLNNDPRFTQLLETKTHHLYHLNPGASKDFVTDWRIDVIDTHSFGEYRQRRERRTADWQHPPGASKSYVELPPQFEAPKCWWARHEKKGSEPVEIVFSAAGPTRVYLDGEKTLETTGEENAVVNAHGAMGNYREVVIHTCPGALGSGFFWRETPVQ